MNGVGRVALVTGIGAVALSGCGVERLSSARLTPRQEVRQSAPKANSGDPSVLDPRWIMPNHLPSPPRTAEQRIEGQVWPIYNTQLAMNRFPKAWHGNDLVNTWKLPPKWAPYLYKNEKHVLPFVSGHRPNLNKVPLTLYITLQGTVFLYPETIMESQWPMTKTVGDLPPSTIVAEFVPLRAAVKAGIIPVSDQPVSGGFVSSTWQKALGMTAAEIAHAYR